MSTTGQNHVLCLVRGEQPRAKQMALDSEMPKGSLWGSVFAPALEQLETRIQGEKKKNLRTEKKKNQLHTQDGLLVWEDQEKSKITENALSGHRKQNSKVAICASIFGMITYSN